MDLPDIALLVAAGLAAGTINAVAGGGSLVTFPALVATGLPPVAANVTNSVAVSPGYLASVAGGRDELAGQGARMRMVLPAAALGSLAGSVVLLVTPARAFELVVPFLVLGATATLAVQDRLRAMVSRRSGSGARHQRLALPATVATGSVYGGYFGAALGVMMVAALGLVLEEPLARLNALKNVVSAIVGLVTVVVFALFGPVNWIGVAVVSPATLVGGYVGARVARRLPSGVLKAVIVTFGTVIGVLLLVRAL